LTCCSRLAVKTMSAFLSNGCEAECSVTKVADFVIAPQSRMKTVAVSFPFGDEVWDMESSAQGERHPTKQAAKAIVVTVVMVRIRFTNQLPPKLTQRFFRLMTVISVILYALLNQFLSRRIVAVRRAIWRPPVAPLRLGVDLCVSSAAQDELLGYAMSGPCGSV